MRHKSANQTALIMRPGGCYGKEQRLREVTSNITEETLVMLRVICLIV